jgi:hypothetical protein
MTITDLYIIGGLFLIGHALCILKKQFFNMKDSNEMENQAIRCFKDNFSIKSMSWKPSLPSSNGCHVTKDDDGAIDFNFQTRLSSASIF